MRPHAWPDRDFFVADADDEVVQRLFVLDFQDEHALRGQEEPTGVQLRVLLAALLVDASRGQGFSCVYSSPVFL